LGSNRLAGAIDATDGYAVDTARYRSASEVTMESSGTGERTSWRFGVHPAAVGSVIRTMSRVDLPVGYGLRVEMADPASADVVHVQYHIATASGGWALWITSAVDKLRSAEEGLPDLVIPADPDPSA
jgi:hypothetical protein